MEPLPIGLFALMSIGTVLPVVVRAQDYAKGSTPKKVTRIDQSSHSFTLRWTFFNKDLAKPFGEMTKDSRHVVTYTTNPQTVFKFNDAPDGSASWKDIRLGVSVHVGPYFPSGTHAAEKVVIDRQTD